MSSLNGLRIAMYLAAVARMPKPRRGITSSANRDRSHTETWKRWTPEEDEMLVRLLQDPNVYVVDLVKHFHGRTLESLRQRVSGMQKRGALPHLIKRREEAGIKRRRSAARRR